MRYVVYHKDGTVRMDWYTFKNMKIDRIMAAIEENSSVSVRPRPISKGSKVKVFA